MLKNARLESMTIEAGKDTDIDVGYRGPYHGDPEFIVVDLQLDGGRSIQIKVAYEAAVRWYGGLGEALKEKDRCDETRRAREEHQRKAEADECQRVGERR